MKVDKTILGNLSVCVCVPHPCVADVKFISWAMSCGRDRNITTCSFTADNGTMHLWDWRTGYNFQRVHAAVQPGSLDSESGIFACAFDRSESRLLTAEADKTIKVYREDETAVSS